MFASVNVSIRSPMPVLAERTSVGSAKSARLSVVGVVGVVGAVRIVNTG